MTNGLDMPSLIAISRFCGLPIGLIVLPMVIANASDSNSTLGEIEFLLASRSIRGVPIIAMVSFISRAESSPMLKIIKTTRLFIDLAWPKIELDNLAISPLCTMDSPMTNMQNRKSMMSKLMDLRASAGDICPVMRTAMAPASMICHICSRNRPIRRTDMSRNTSASTIIKIIKIKEALTDFQKYLKFFLYIMTLL